MNVKSRQQENAEATREALLESALSAFIEHGYGGVSIDAIAREARVTKARSTTTSAASRNCSPNATNARYGRSPRTWTGCRRRSTSGRRPPRWPRPSSTA
ncbi:TetR family transcriptional regulator [Pseudomonas aeruginosa]|uniref:TetR family transcriptional regulator n=1 Tax=Pseudomonas aeruginosa TaxID=287 RepID=UPI003D05EE09